MYVRTYIRTYIHAYIHAYADMHMSVSVYVSVQLCEICITHNTVHQKTKLRHHNILLCAPSVRKEFPVMAVTAFTGCVKGTARVRYKMCSHIQKRHSSKTCSSHLKNVSPLILFIGLFLMMLAHPSHRRIQRW